MQRIIPWARPMVALTAALASLGVSVAPIEQARAQRPSTPVTVVNPDTSPVPTTVVNPAAMPALTSRIDDPGRIPYSAQLQAGPSCNFTGLCEFGPPPVPSGKRLVIQHVAVETDITPTSVVLVQIFPGHGGGPILSAYQVPVVGSFGQGDSLAAGDQAVQVYVDGGNSFVVDLETNGVFLSPSRLTVSGYLLDCTVNQCAAIAP